MSPNGEKSLSNAVQITTSSQKAVSCNLHEFQIFHGHAN